MPSKSPSQHNLMEAVAHNPKFAKKVGIPQTVGKEFVSADKKMKDGGPSLAIGRGEKLPASQGAGLTAKGREKYNRETGSNLKAPQPQGGPRRDSFCARMGPVAEKSEKGSRARASMRRWNCPGW